MPFHEETDDDWIFDPDLAAINRSLQRELREEAEELEIVTEESELRSRSFADVAREIRNRGDHVSIMTSHRVFLGRIVYAAGDFISVDTQEFSVDINLADVAFMRLLRDGRDGAGRPNIAGPGTFEMRLLERQSRVTDVEIGFRQFEQTLTGAIIAVAQDHVLVIDHNKTECTAPIAGISYVIRRNRRSLR